MRRILVTRPQPSADRTAADLRKRGFEPLTLPLTRTIPLTLEAHRLQQNDIAAVAITSANAVRHAPPALLAQIARLPVYAVGGRTGETARAGGLDVVDMKAGDAAVLVGRIAAAVTPGQQILVLCGRARRDTVEEGLVRAGFSVFLAETYDTLSLSYSDQDVLRALGEQPVDAVLLYSALAAEAFKQLSGREPLAWLFRDAAYFVISDRVARHLPDTAPVYIAEKPTEEAIFSLLAK